jgi:predicted nucleic acid-binding protein
MQSAFVDTNVYLYHVDLDEPKKREIAKQLISELGDNAVSSTQVLQEFYWNATKKHGIPPSNALRFLEVICKRKVIQVTPALITSAIDTSERYRISFWDALIVEAAAAAHCQVLYTENLNDGQKIRGVLVQNPFR